MTSEHKPTRPIKFQAYGDFGPKPRLHPVYVAFVWAVAIVLAQLGQFVGLLPGLTTGLITRGANGFSSIGLLYILFFGFGTAALFNLLWVRFVENRPLASIGLRLEAAGARFARGLLIGMAFNIAAVFIIYALGGYEIATIMPVFSAPSAILLIALFLLGFIVQGSTEEILLRGWVMSALASRFGIVIAIVVNSTVFGALHLGNESGVNWIAMANIVLVGVYLSLYALREASLLGVCGFHAAWNWLMGVGFGLDVSGMTIDAPALLVDFDTSADAPPWLTGGTFGPEGSLVVSLLLIGGVFWILRTRKEKAHA